MSRRDAAQIIERHGGIVVETASELPELVVVGDEAGDARKAVREAIGGEFSAQWDSVEIITESELWQRLGLVDEDAGVQAL